ncbi:MAG: DEAD/DEAH box helicase family protein, partial [Candidatus Pacebacteria bacterium]|nr:DEAD/DEAH box helicase family protein [Candidatus Paceibacterota bacterium]
MQHQKHLSLPVLQACFPRNGKYKNGPWKSQGQIMEFVAEHPGTVIIESPTGSGKTAVEYAIIAASRKSEKGPAFLVTPNKTILEQIMQEGFPDLKVALGRNEHKCLYYKEDVGADEVPCSMLRDCPHRIDQSTGKTSEPGVSPCPYLLQKYEARQGSMIACTMAFYLFSQLFSRAFDDPACLVIDEAHRIADVVRSSLSYEISDWHLKQSIELLEKIGAGEAKILKKFLTALKRIAKAKKRAAYEETLLDDDEIRRLISILEGIDPDALIEKVERAVRKREIDPVNDRVVLKKLEMLVRDLRRYIHSFEYSLEAEGRKPLNYTCAFYKGEKGENGKVQYKLVIKCYYVAPLIRKILARSTAAFSATIGKPDVFGYETGIRGAYLSLDSAFPVDHTRIYMPSNTPNLAMKARGKRDMTKTLRQIARACKRFAQKGHRSLVVTISNAEREKFLMLAKEEGVDAV